MAHLLAALRAVASPSTSLVELCLTYGDSSRSLTKVLDVGAPEPGVSVLSLQEAALLSLVQEVVSARCLLPCLPATLRTCRPA